MGTLTATNSFTEKQLEDLAVGMPYFGGPDTIYEKLADLKLKRKDYEGAIETAEKISDFVISDHVFRSIFSQAADLKTKEKVAEKMSGWGSTRDASYLEVVNAKLAKNDFEGAYQTALKMSGWTSERDDVLMAIVEKAPDLEFAGRVFSGVNPFSSMSQTAFEKLIGRIMTFIDQLLGKKDYTAALKFIGSKDFKFNKDQLLSKILEKMEGKDFTKENLKLIEAVIDQLSADKQKEVLQKLVDQYTSLKDPQEATRIKAKITKIEEAEKKVRELLIKFQSDCKPPVKKMMVLSGLAGGGQAIAAGWSAGIVCLTALSAALVARLMFSLMDRPYAGTHRFQSGMFSF